MRRKLNESIEVAQWQDNEAGRVLLSLRDYIAQNQAKRSWPIYAIADTGTSNNVKDYSIFRLKHELNFQWSNGAQQQVAKLEANDEGMTVGQFVDDVAAIYEHEFTSEHGIDQANKDNEFASKFVVNVVDGDVTLKKVKFIESSVLESYFIADSRNGQQPKTVVDKIEEYMNNIQNAVPPANDVSFWRDYAQFAVTGTYPDSVNLMATATPLRDPQHQLFSEWWKTCLLAISMMPSNDKQQVLDNLASHGFSVAQHGHSYTMTGYTPQQTQNQPQQTQNQQQPAAQQEQPTTQQPETVNAQIEINLDRLGYYKDWYDYHKVYVIGRLERDQFESWWNAQRPEFKRAVLGNHNALRYVKFQGTLDDRDSTTRRTQLIIWDHQNKDLKIFGQMSLPRKQRPLYNVLYAFRCESARDFIPFARMPNGDWHGHLYSLRNSHINYGRHGMRVLYDPDGYLNALYLARPSGLTLHDVGPGVPQTIGNNVTSDLTIGIPRTQLRPLTQAEQAAIDAQNEEHRRAQEQARAAEHERQLQIQTAKEEMATKSQQLKQDLPQIFNRPEFKNIVQYWPGNPNVESTPQNFTAPKNQEYVILRFPGTSNIEVVGANEVSEFASSLGMLDKIQPILDLVAARFPNAKPMLKFNGRLR